MDFVADVRDRRQAYGDRTMKRYLLFGIFVSGVLVLALAGWALGALRWALTGSARPHAADGLTPAWT